MYSLIIAIVVGAATAGITRIWMGWPWAVFTGTLGFIGASFLLSRVFGKRLTALVTQVQDILQGSQGEVDKMLNRFQAKPLGSVKLMQDQVEKVVERRIIEALAVLETARPLYRWSLLADRQVDTLKMQLNYQLKRWDDVDRLMPRVMILEPLTLCMKMVRQYERDDAALDKTFRKGVKKFKYEKATLIYALYAWILMKRKNVDKAVEILAIAKDKCENEVLKRNWQHLANGKPQLVSWRELGEQWYALQLETPPKAKAGKGAMRDNPMYGGRIKRR